MKASRTPLSRLGNLIRQGFDPTDVALIATRVMVDLDQEDFAYLAGPILHGEGEPPPWLMEHARAQRYRVVGGELRDFPCTAEEIVLVLGWGKRIEIGSAEEADLLLWARELAERHRRGLPCAELERSADVVGARGRLNGAFRNYGGAVRQLVQESGSPEAQSLCANRSPTQRLM